MQVCAHRVRRMQASKRVATLKFSRSDRCALTVSYELLRALDLNWKGMFLVPLARHGLFLVPLARHAKLIWVSVSSLRVCVIPWRAPNAELARLGGWRGLLAWVLA